MGRGLALGQDLFAANLLAATRCRAGRSAVVYVRAK